MSESESSSQSVSSSSQGAGSKTKPLYTTGEKDKRVYPKPSPEALVNFKQQLDEWVKIDEHIRKLSIALRERRVHRKALDSTILTFMTSFGYEKINRKDGSMIKSKVKEVKQPVTLGVVRNKLSELHDKEFSGDQWMEKLFNDETRPTVERKSLRRVVPKVSLHLDI